MWTNPLKTADFVIFTEEILNEKLYFLSSVTRYRLTEKSDWNTKYCIVE